jgi:hypothetical protein
MNSREAFVARSVWWKTSLALISAFILIAGCVLLVLMSVSAAECWQARGLGCPWRISSRRFSIEIILFLAWIALPYFVFATWRFFSVRATTAPYLVIDDKKVSCRDWPLPLVMSDITSVEVRTIPYFLWLPRLGHRYRLRFTTSPDKVWYADIGFRGLVRRLLSRMRLELQFYDTKSGRYDLVLRGVDQPQIQVIEELDARLGARVMHLD